MNLRTPRSRLNLTILTARTFDSMQLRKIETISVKVTIVLNREESVILSRRMQCRILCLHSRDTGAFFWKKGGTEAPIIIKKVRGGGGSPGSVYRCEWHVPWTGVVGQRDPCRSGRKNWMNCWEIIRHRGGSTVCWTFRLGWFNVQQSRPTRAVSQSHQGPKESQFFAES